MKRFKSRKKLRRSKSRKLFSKTASKVNKRNNNVTPMRGGYRL